MPVRGVELHLRVAQLQLSRDGQRLEGSERKRGRPLDVVLGVRVAKLALGQARLGPQALGRGLPDAQRQLREREPAEQVVVVGVRGE